MPRLEIELQNGTTQQVDFDSMPTDNDIDEVAKHLSSIQPTIGQNFDKLQQPNTFDAVKDSLYEPNDIGTFSQNPILPQQQQAQRQNVIQNNSFIPSKMTDDNIGQYSDLQRGVWNFGKPNDNEVMLGDKNSLNGEYQEFQTPDDYKKWQPADATFKLGATKSHYLGDYQEQATPDYVNAIPTLEEKYDRTGFYENLKPDYSDDVDIDGNYIDNPQIQQQEELLKQFKQRENEYNLAELQRRNNSTFLKDHPYLYNIKDALRRGGHMFRGGVYNTIGKLGSVANNENLVNWAYNKAMDANARLNSIENGQGKVNYVTGMFGENAPMMAGGLITAARTLGSSTPLGAALNLSANFIWNALFTTNFFENRRALEEKFGRPLTKSEMVSLIGKDTFEQCTNAVLEGASDFVTSKILAAGLKPTSNVMLNVAANIVTDTIGEASTEYLQEGKSIDTEQSLGLNNATSVENAERQNEAAKGGAIMGGIMGGLGSARAALMGEYNQNTPQPPQEPTSHVEEQTGQIIPEQVETPQNEAPSMPKSQPTRQQAEENAKRNGEVDTALPKQEIGKIEKTAKAEGADTLQRNVRSEDMESYDEQQEKYQQELERQKSEYDTLSDGAKEFLEERNNTIAENPSDLTYLNNPVITEILDKYDVNKNGDLVYKKSGKIVNDKKRRQLINNIVSKLNSQIPYREYTKSDGDKYSVVQSDKDTAVLKDRNTGKLYNALTNGGVITKISTQPRIASEDILNDLTYSKQKEVSVDENEFSDIDNDGEIIQAAEHDKYSEPGMFTRSTVDAMEADKSYMDVSANSDFRRVAKAVEETDIIGHKVKFLLSGAVRVNDTYNTKWQNSYNTKESEQLYTTDDYFNDLKRHFTSKEDLYAIEQAEQEFYNPKNEITSSAETEILSSEQKEQLRNSNKLREYNKIKSRKERQKLIDEIDKANQENNVEKAAQIIDSNNIKRKYLTSSQQRVFDEHYMQRAAKANKEIRDAIENGDAKTAQRLLDKHRNVIYNDVAYSGDSRENTTFDKDINKRVGTGLTWEGVDVGYYEKLAQRKIDDYQKQIDKINKYKTKTSKIPSNMHYDAENDAFKKTSNNVDKLFGSDGSDITSYVNSNKSVSSLSSVYKKLLDKYNHPTNDYQFKQQSYANNIKNHVGKWGDSKVYLIHGEQGGKVGESDVAFRIDKNDNIYIDAANDNPAQLISQAIDKINSDITQNGSRLVRGYVEIYDNLPSSDIVKSNKPNLKDATTFEERLNKILEAKNKGQLYNTSETDKFFYSQSDEDLTNFDKNKKSNLKSRLHNFLLKLISKKILKLSDKNPVFSFLKHNFEGFEDFSNYHVVINNGMISMGRHREGYIFVNLKAIGDNEFSFVETVVHELQHAKQTKYYNELKNKQNLTEAEKQFINDYNDCIIANREIREAIHGNEEVLRNIYNDTKELNSNEYYEYCRKLSKSDWSIYYKYLNAKIHYSYTPLEMESRYVGKQLSEQYARTYGRTFAQDVASGKTNGRRWLNGLYSPKIWSKSQGRKNERLDDGSFSDIDLDHKNLTQQEITKLYEDLQNAEIERSGAIEQKRLDIEDAVSKFNKSVKQAVGGTVKPEIARKLIPFLREGNGFPKTMPELKKVYSRLNDGQKNKLQKLAQGLHNSLSSHWDEYTNLHKNISTIDNAHYVPYKFKGKTREDQKLLNSYFENEIKKFDEMVSKNKTVSGFTNSNNPLDLKLFSEHQMYRHGNSLSDIIDNGLNVEIPNGIDGSGKPKFKSVNIKVVPELDYSKLLSNHANDLSETNENAKFINKFADKKMSDGRSVVDYHAYKQFFDRMMQNENKVDNSRTILGKVYDKTNALAKSLEFFGSFFHHRALSESAAAVSWKGFGKSVLQGKYVLSEMKELAKDAAKHGVKFGALSDAQIKEVESILDKVFIIKDLKRINDKVLWEYLHNSFKLMAYDIHCELWKRANNTDTIPKEIKQEIAQLSNDFFGGQHWGNLNISQKGHRWLQRLLKSPDWNLSATLREFMGNFSSARGQAFLNKHAKNNKIMHQVREILRKIGVASINNSVEGAKARGNFSRRYTLRYLINQKIILPLIISGFYTLRDALKNPEDYDDISKLNPYRKGNKFSDGDESFIENALNFALPDTYMGKDKNGVEQYARTGKQGREFLEFIENGRYSAFDKLASKAAPIPSALLTEVSSTVANNSNKLHEKHKYGWKNGAVTRNKDKEGYSHVKEHPFIERFGKNLLSQFTPFSYKDNPDKTFVENLGNSAKDVLRDGLIGRPSTKDTNFYSAVNEAKAKIIRGELTDNSYDFARRIKSNNHQRFDKSVVGEGIVSNAAEQLIREHQDNPENVQKIVNQLRDYGVPEWKIKYTLEYGYMTEEEAQELKNKRKAKHKK